MQIVWSSERSMHLVFPDEEVDAGAHRSLGILLSDTLPEMKIEIVPGATTLLIDFGEEVVGSVRPTATQLEHLVLECISRANTGLMPTASARTVGIPICYEQACAPDLDWVAYAAGISVEEAIALHSSAVYTVRLIGFAPGFAYLDGLPDLLHAPRLNAPRTRVPAGSVGIAGGRTGIYPHDSPGGWRLIGTTPCSMFDPRREPPSLLSPGDVVRFEAISLDEYQTMRAAAHEETR